MTALSLAALDNAPPLSCDPGVLARNLAALAEVDPPSAELIRSTTLPDHWRATIGLDGSPAWRIEEPHRPAEWLVGAAAPQHRAEGLLAPVAVQDRNPVLASVDVGAEILLLMQRRPLHQAIFAYSASSAQVRALLIVHELSAVLREQSLILLIEPHAEARLSDVLSKHAGLAAPSTIIPLPHTAENELHALRALCERISSAISHAKELRMAALREDRARMRNTRTNAGMKERVAVVAMTADRIDHRLAYALADSAESAGVQALPFASDRPTHAHALGAAEAIATHGAIATLFVSSVPQPLRPIAGPAARWLLRTPDPAERLAETADLFLPASPEIGAALRCMNVPPDQVVSFYWGCFNAPDGRGAVAAAPPQNDLVAVLADVPSADAAACGVEQPTHKILWQCARELVQGGWQTSLAISPAELLAAAERRAGVRISEENIREAMVRGLGQFLIPATVVECVVAELRQINLAVWGVGRGWSRLLRGPADRHSEDLLDCGERDPAPRAAISAGPIEPWQRDFPSAAARGWRLLVHSPGSGERADAVRNVLGERDGFEEFADARGMTRLLRSAAISDKGERARAEQRANRASARHAYSVRWKVLMKRLSSGQTAENA